MLWLHLDFLNFDFNIQMVIKGVTVLQLEPVSYYFTLLV